MKSALDLIRRSAGVAVVALLAGCTDTDPGLIPYAEWQQMDPPPRLEVRDAPVAHAVNLKFAPDVRFLADESFDEVLRIDEVLRSPHVLQDLKKA